MIKKKLSKHIDEAINKGEQQIELFKEEKKYAEKHDLLAPGLEVVLKLDSSRFSDAYIERCEKETDALILVESPSFLEQSTDHLLKHRNEFVFVESKAFEIIGVEAISLEFDDVFKTVSAMFGLKLQKKFGPAMKEYLENHLVDEEGKYSIQFSMADGLWDVNFALSYVEGFKADMPLSEAYQLLYNFIFSLVETVEEIE